MKAQHTSTIVRTHRSRDGKVVAPCEDNMGFAVESSNLGTRAAELDSSDKILRTREELEACDVTSEGWQQALQRRYRTHQEMKGVLNNVEEVDMSIYDHFDMRVTPYLAQLMDRDNPNCPIRRQYMPFQGELKLRDYELADSLSEDHDMKDGSTVVHRYPNRVLFLVTTNCGTYCRYCTRKRFVSQGERVVNKRQLENGFRYLESHPEIDDCLVSGGDPLFLSDRQLEDILSQIRGRAPHVKFLRMGSRLPVQLPTRITPELCAIIERYDVQMINLHVNHPKEITPLFVERIKMLRKTGTMIGNQSVLLKGVNDEVAILRDLCMRLVSCGIRPYYCYSCDAAEGNHAYQLTLNAILKLHHGLRGFISGPAVPTFVVDGTGGLGKMPIIPDYVRELANGEIWATNFEGKVHRMINLEARID
ncbi:KamA family radical SAM protein [Bradyrhizobium sp. CIAT3101]|uniref:KamA family radical SAM protein n=1 Tax=Bradyrhizobium sp. CIAT3101 TaxID=439387 RepID=UPI0024B07F41|nr:KamA family radical SAM protein [Bradyrhizobium sp. CIAT3101]WFU80551.1 KamA family radical SAM protein [Bradyrhizobium sp. CIAT3101]